MVRVEERGVLKSDCVWLKPGIHLALAAVCAPKYTHTHILVVPFQAKGKASPLPGMRPHVRPFLRNVKAAVAIMNLEVVLFPYLFPVYLPPPCWSSWVKDIFSSYIFPTARCLPSGWQRTSDSSRPAPSFCSLGEITT